MTALILSGYQLPASAQTNEQPSPANEQSTSFADLLDQLGEGEQTDDADERPQLPRPAALDNLPTVPEPNTPPVFPAEDGEPRELPWDGLRATTAFVKIDDGVEHTLSKLRCADNIAGYKLNHIRQITEVGEAVTCRYEHDRGLPDVSSLENPTAHVLMFRPTATRTIEAQMADFQSDTEAKFETARLLSSDVHIVEFVDRELTCPSVAYALGPEANAQVLTTVICQAGDWRLRIRHIAQPDSGTPSVTAFANQLASVQAPAMRHVDRCNAFLEKLANETPSGITGISYNAVAFPYLARGDSCYAGSTTSAEGSVLVRFWPDNPDTPITIDLLSPNGQYQDKPSFRIQNMWANVPAEEAGPAAYLLMREQADGTITVYQGYTRIPTDARAYQDTTAAYNGESDAIFLARQNDGGGWTMMAQ